MKHSRVMKLAAAAAAAFVFGSPAVAGTVGGEVAPINTLGTQTFTNTLTDLAVGGTDVTVVSSTISNNNDRGWSLTVTSANSGKLLREATAVDDGVGGVGREILYSTVKLVKTGGTLGDGLTDPSGTSQSVTGGAVTPAVFNTRSGGVLGTATTATVNYAFDLKISWSADTRLLSGNYTDEITLNLANDL